MNNKIRSLIIIVLLLVVFIIFGYPKLLLYFNNGVVKQTADVTPQEKIIIPENDTAVTEIIKCQNVVVTPKTTTELFTYTSGNKIRYDYRVGSTSEANSFSTQFLYDGDTFYIWDKPQTFKNSSESTDATGVKMAISKFDNIVDESILDEVKQFGSAGFSGDRLCRIWDDVDPVFDIPTNITFDETDDALKIYKNKIDRICAVCEATGDDSLRNICLQNLSCVSN